MAFFEWGFLVLALIKGLAWKSFYKGSRIRRKKYKYMNYCITYREEFFNEKYIIDIFIDLFQLFERIWYLIKNQKP